jgi:hypothetical protein
MQRRMRMRTGTAVRIVTMVPGIVGTASAAGTVGAVGTVVGIDKVAERRFTVG